MLSRESNIIRHNVLPVIWVRPEPCFRGSISIHPKCHISTHYQGKLRGQRQRFRSVGPQIVVSWARGWLPVRPQIVVSRAPGRCQSGSGAFDSQAPGRCQLGRPGRTTNRPSYSNFDTFWGDWAAPSKEKTWAGEKTWGKGVRPKRPKPCKTWSNVRPQSPNWQRSGAQLTTLSGPN